MRLTRQCASVGCVPGTPWWGGGRRLPGAAATRCATPRSQIRPCTCGGCVVGGTRGWSGQCMTEVRGQLQGGAPRPPRPMQAQSPAAVGTRRCAACRTGPRRRHPPYWRRRRRRCGRAAATSSPPSARPRRRCRGCAATRARLHLLPQRPRRRRAVGTRLGARLVVGVGGGGWCARSAADDGSAGAATTAAPACRGRGGGGGGRSRRPGRVGGALAAARRRRGCIHASLFWFFFV